MLLMIPGARLAHHVSAGPDLPEYAQTRMVDQSERIRWGNLGTLFG